MRRLSRLDGRVVAGGAVVVFFAVLLLFRATTGVTPWATVGVAPGDLSFADLRSVTSSWDCERRGVEAFPYNPCDPFIHSSAFRRAANYPRLWTSFWHLGLGEGDTVPLGVAIAVVFYVAALAVTGPLTLGEGVVYAAALLAPATLLGVERGNVDLLMFALIVAGLLLLPRSAWAAAVPLVLAGVLKLFPAAGIAVLFRRRGRFIAGLAAAAVLVAYGLATLSDIRTLRSVIPREVVNSYGAGVVADALRSTGVSWAQTGSDVRYVRLAVLVLGLLLAALLLQRRWLPGRTSLGSDNDRRMDAFWAGGAVYSASYVFGNNFDYRLAFLLLCVPQLCAWGRRPGLVGRMPWVVLGALIATLWLSSAQPPLPFGLQTWYEGLSFPPEEILNWALFAWIIGAVVATAPLALPRRLAWGGVR